MKHTFTRISGTLVGALILLSPLAASANTLSAEGNASLHLGSKIGLFHGDKEKSEKSKDKKKDHSDKRFGVYGVVATESGSTLTLQSGKGTTYTVNTASADFKGGSAADISMSDVLLVSGKVDGSTIIASRIVNITEIKNEWREKAAHAKAGVVTAISGSGFTIEPFSLDSALSITTDSATLFKQNGEATTSSALAVGSRVMLSGTSTGSTSFSASIVEIFTKGFGHMKHWFKTH